MPEGDSFLLDTTIFSTVKFQYSSVVYALSRGVYCRVKAPLHVEEILSSDSCSRGTVFDHVMDFSLTVGSFLCT